MVVVHLLSPGVRQRCCATVNVVGWMRLLATTHPEAHPQSARKRGVEEMVACAGCVDCIGMCIPHAMVLFGGSYAAQQRVMMLLLHAIYMVSLCDKTAAWRVAGA